MKHVEISTNTFFICTLLYLVMPHNAHAYLDPGTGSLILQAIIVGFIGAVATAKLWYGRFKGFIARLFSRDKSIGDQ